MINNKTLYHNETKYHNEIQINPKLYIIMKQIHFTFLDTD